MCVGAVRPGLAIALGILATLIVLLSERGISQIPYSPAEAHRYADIVLVPKLTAVYNDWALRHPTGEEHYRNLDAGDVKRWQTARKTFRELDKALKRAGY